MTDYWLRPWLRQYGVTSVSRARAAIRDKALRADLIDRAREAAANTESVLPHAPSLIAGRVLDLSCELDVFAWDFLKLRVDQLFAKVWHYFDTIAVVGAPPEYFAGEWKDTDEFDRRILLYVQLLLHLRRIGAERYITFVRKPPVDEHPEHHFEFSGPLDERRELQLARQLASRSSVSFVQQHGNHFHYRLDDTGLDHSQWGHVLGDTANLSHEQILEIACRAVVRRFAAYLESDLKAASNLGSPLGIGLDIHHAMAMPLPGSPAENVAFHINLPVLEGVSAETLLKLRRDEYDAFEAFRDALKRAISERLSAGSDAAVVATEIQQDVIEPAIRDISRRLSSAKAVMAKKSALRVGLGSIATGIGLVTGIPMLAGAGATSVLAGLTAIDTFTDAVREVKLSDMYFAWRASTL